MSTKKLCIFFAVFFFANSVSFALNGSGSEMDPYVIVNRSDFDAFCGNTAYWAAGVYTQLDADIDLSGTTYTQAPIAGDATASNYNGIKYCGSFDGGGHVIMSLTVSDALYAGLFGYISSDGSVSNLGVENAGISEKLDPVACAR